MIGAVAAAKYAGVALLALVTLVGLLYVTGVIGVPDGGLEDNEWGEVNEDRIEIATTVWIDNPNPFGASVDRVDYDLAMNDVHLASGGSEEVSIPSGNDTVSFRTDLDYASIPQWWAAHVRQGETSQVDVEATIHVSGAGRSASRPVSYQDEIQTDVESMLAEALSELEGEYTPSGGGDATVAEPTVEIRDTDAEWGTVTEEQTQLRAEFEVHNPNAYPIPTPGFGGEFTMNEVGVLQWDANDVDVVDEPSGGTIPPVSTETIVLGIDLDNERFAEWFATHVDAEERTNASLSAHLSMDVAGYEIRMPRDGEAVRCDYDVRTSIFVEQPSGLEDRGCQFTPWETTSQDLEDADATLDDPATGGSDDGADGGSDGDGSSGSDDDSGSTDGSGPDGGPDGDGGLLSPGFAGR